MSLEKDPLEYTSRSTDTPTQGSVELRYVQSSSDFIGRYCATLASDNAPANAVRDFTHG